MSREQLKKQTLCMLPVNQQTLHTFGQWSIFHYLDIVTGQPIYKALHSLFSGLSDCRGRGQ